MQRADWLFCFFLGVPFSLRLDLLVAGPPPPAPTLLKAVVTKHRVRS